MLNTTYFVMLASALLLSACTASVATTTPAAPTIAPAPTATPAAAPEPTAVPSATPPRINREAVDAFDAARRLGRGVNFGNMLEAPTEGEWGIRLDESYFDLVKAGGFNTIRLPVRWSAHALAEAPYTIDPVFFARVDWAVDNATRRGLNIVVNMHHYDDLMKKPKEHQARFVALWRQIGSRYADRPHSVLLEICNEPNGMSANFWNGFFLDVLAAVRESNPTRIVVIGGTDWNSVNGLLELKLPAADRNLLATFHYYSPFEFTHQGAEWVSGADAWMGTKWDGVSRDKSNVDWDLDRAAAWAKDNERPLWMGEFGAYSKANMAARSRWTAYLAREAERRSITWSYWEFGAGFGVYDRVGQTWVEPIKRALIP